MYSILIVTIALWVVATGYSIVLPGKAGDRRVGFLTLMLTLMAFSQVATLLSAKGLVPFFANPPVVGLFGLLVPAAALLAVFSLDRMLIVRGRAQAALRERERMYRTLAELSPEGIFCGDPSGRCEFMNQRWRDISGQPPEEALGRGWMDRVHPDDRQHTIDVFEAGKREGRGFMRCEFRLVHPDRGPASALWQLMALRGGSGETTGYVGTITDISELRRAEQQLEEARDQLQARVEERTAELVAANRGLEAKNAELEVIERALRQSEQQLQAILDNTPAVIHVKDIEGRYQLVNRQFEKLSHATREEVYGKTAHEVLPQEAADVFRANELKVLEGNRALQFEEAIMQDDELHHYVSNRFPLRDSSNAPVATACIATDITELVHARQERDRFFDLSLDMMGTGDIDGYLKVCNPAFASTLGYRPEELPGMHFSDFIHPDERERGLAEFERLRSGISLEDYEIRWLCKDGAEKWLWWKVVPVLEEKKMYAVARDITSKKLAEETLGKHREKIAHLLRVHTMGELASQIAHELNQPLSAIASYASGTAMRLEAGGAETTEIVAVIRKISEQALEAGRLIHRIRQFVTKGGLQLERVDLNTLVEAAVALLKPGTGRSVEFRLELEPSLPEIEVDAAQIEQVMVNLMRNGIDAMQAGGEGDRRLLVRTSRADSDNIEFEVQDAGVGLPPGKLDNVFEPFFTTKPSGLGMGLAISRTIMEAHGGRLWASRNPDGGATFRGMMPIRQATS